MTIKERILESAIDQIILELEDRLGIQEARKESVLNGNRLRKKVREYTEQGKRLKTALFQDVNDQIYLDSQQFGEDLEQFFLHAPGYAYTLYMQLLDDQQERFATDDFDSHLEVFNLYQVLKDCLSYYQEPEWKRETRRKQ